MPEYALIIDGKRIATEDDLAVINPADHTLVGHMPLADAGHVDLAVAAARRAFPQWRDTPDAERKRLCLALADALAAHSEELAHLITAEQGKPLARRGSRFELDGGISWTRATAALDLPIELIEDKPGARVELHRKPIGVVCSITPWNYPVMIACWHIIPALRTGNTVVIKPSPLTPLATLRMVEIMNNVLPPGVLNVLTGDDELAAAMTRHEGFDKLVFTGSTATGRKIMAAAAPTLKRLTLELGGNDAGIVLPDADVDAVAEGIFWGAFLNNGQTCAALKRLYVPEALFDPLCSALTRMAERVRTGNGLDESSDFGPVQNKAQFERIGALVEDAVAQGARILIGGAPKGGQGYFYPVTLVAEAKAGMRLVDEEQFGPVLPIIRYGTVDEAVAMANSSSLGLGGSVWSSNTEAARQVAARLECGSVWVNRHGSIQPNAPFGGIKQSGIGTEFGIEGLKEFTVHQSMFL